METECESCGNKVEESTLKKSFLDEMSCPDCIRQHKYLDLVGHGKVPKDIAKKVDEASTIQIRKYFQTGVYDHSLTADLFKELGLQ